MFYIFISQEPNVLWKKSLGDCYMFSRLSVNRGFREQKYISCIVFIITQEVCFLLNTNAMPILLFKLSTQGEKTDNVKYHKSANSEWQSFDIIYKTKSRKLEWKVNCCTDWSKLPSSGIAWVSLSLTETKWFCLSWLIWILKLAYQICYL